MTSAAAGRTTHRLIGTSAPRGPAAAPGGRLDPGSGEEPGLAAEPDPSGAATETGAAGETSEAPETSAASRVAARLESLIGAATDGDPTARAVLLAEIHPLVLRYCRARLGRSNNLSG